MTIDGPALDAFNTRLCQKLDLSPTPWLLTFLHRWAAGENTGAAYNPFATTWEDPQLENPVNRWWNTFEDEKTGTIRHVRNYRSLEAGVEATARTIRQPAYYATIRSVLNKQAISPADRPKLVADIRTWGTTAFANQLADGWSPAPVTPVTDPEHIQQLTDQLVVLMDQVDRLNAAVLARFAAVNAGGVALLKGATLTAFALQRAADPAEIPWEEPEDGSS